MNATERALQHCLDGNDMREPARPPRYHCEGCHWRGDLPYFFDPPGGRPFCPMCTAWLDGPWQGECIDEP